MSKLEGKTVSVVGRGYVCLPIATIMASRNVNVIGYDKNEAVVEKLNKGELHIVEPYMDSLFESAIITKHLSVSSKPVKADIFVIAVPTHVEEDH